MSKSMLHTRQRAVGIALLAAGAAAAMLVAQHGSGGRSDLGSASVKNHGVLASASLNKAKPGSVSLNTVKPGSVSLNTVKPGSVSLNTVKPGSVSLN